jgi:hypothetical protein
MTVDFGNLIALGSLFFLGITVIVGLVYWIVGQFHNMRTEYQKEIASRDAAILRAHERLDRLPETYIQRSEMQGHISRLEAGLQEVGANVRMLTSTLIKQNQEK